MGWLSATDRVSPQRQWQGVLGCKILIEQGGIRRTVEGEKSRWMVCGFLTAGSGGQCCTCGQLVIEMLLGELFEVGWLLLSILVICSLV